MADKAKETVYVDVDDEITSIIEKVQESEAKIVALVLPKRATVLQSVVNMKLLKKAGQGVKKNIVLITSEKGLLPLAGVAGLHVAKSLQSKPVIPPMPTHPGEAGDEPDVVDETEPALDRSAPIGALAAAAATADDDTETIEIDNMDMDGAKGSAGAVLAAKAKKLKHLKVPNFDRFRTGIFLGVAGLILLLLGWYFAFIVLPKAVVTIETNTTTAVSSFDFLASTTQSELDVTNRKIPAVQHEVKKSDSEKVKATGQKDMGTKAEGKVTLSIACADVTSFPASVAAGTTVSTGGLNFVTQEAASLNSPAGPGCRFNDTVEVAAAQNGDQYNLASGKSFTVTGNSKISGTNSDEFEGGTSKIVKVVSQKDIDDAVAAINTRTEQEVSDELKAQFDAEELMALTETRKAGEPKTTAAPALDAEAEETTVNVETTYTMLGIQREHLSELITKDVEGESSLQGQEVTDDGIDQAVMRINNQPSPGEAFISLRTSVIAGPQIDEIVIKENIRGKKRGEAESYIKDQPGVNDATIEYSPFWVYSTPKAAKKITVKVVNAGDQTDEDTESNEQ